MDNSWVKLYRKLSNNEVMLDPKALQVFIWVLLHVNKKTGSFNVGRFQISRELKLNPNTIYKTLKRLEKKYKIVTLNSNNRFTTISLLRWADYQATESLVTQGGNNKVTTKQQQSNTKQEYKNKEYKNNTPYSPPKPKEILSLTPQQVEGFAKEFPILTLEEIQQEVVRTRSYIRTTSSPITNPFMFFKSRLVIADREKRETESMNKIAAQTISLPELSEEERAANRERLAVMRQQLKEKFTI